MQNMLKSAPLSSSPNGALGGLRYPERKTYIIFEIPNIEEPRIDILHDFGCV